MEKYVKSQQDADREETDLAQNQTIRFLAHQDEFKFNVGDILIKQSKYGYGDDSQWQTEKTRLGAPVKYLYAFENTVGVGYLKQLKVDGSGCTNCMLVCVANLDPHTTRLMLDPEYADHLLLSGGEQFQYNKVHQEKKEFRKQAIEKNKKILIGSRNQAELIAWFHALQKGDEFYMAPSWDDLVKSKYKVSKIVDNKISSMPSHVRSSIEVPIDKYRTIEVAVLSHPWSQGKSFVYTVDHFFGQKITTHQPFSLEDVLCGPAR
jgi:hypothetical protein